MTTNLFEELCSKLNISWSDIANNDLYSETELSRWLRLSRNEAVARNPWPFTEGRLEIASASGTEKYDYPLILKSDSLRYLTVNDKRYDKKLFEDYLKYKEDYSSGSNKIYSDRNRVLYINHLADDFGNSIVCYGQVIVTGSVDSQTATTVFSTAEPEGDEAIIQLAYSKALGSEKMNKPTQAKKERSEAFEILDGIWKRIQDKQHTYQTKDTSMFKRMDILGGGYEGEIRSRKQF